LKVFRGQELVDRRKTCWLTDEELPGERRVCSALDERVGTKARIVD
jgi:hypothetical protein